MVTRSKAHVAMHMQHEEFSVIRPNTQETMTNYRVILKKNPAKYSLKLYNSGVGTL